MIKINAVLNQQHDVNKNYCKLIADLVLLALKKIVPSCTFKGKRELT
jgi:hypothetical protein